MIESRFVEFIKKWFAYFQGKLEVKINGEIEAGKYLHEQVLTPEYTPDLKWESATVNDSVVAADVVALDSPLPLKKRGAMKTASGTIPKTGMKKYLIESQVQQLITIKNLGKLMQFVKSLFADLEKCGLGIKERVEYMFLQGISTGQMLVGVLDGDIDPDEKGDNTGVAVRADFGFLPENKFGASIPWGDAGYKPISDFVRAMEATETSTSVAWMSKKAYKLMRDSDEAKQLCATFRGIPVLKESVLPTPTKNDFNDAFENEYGVKFKIIDRSIVTEKNGKRKSVKPFDENAIVLLAQDTNLGRLVYGDLVENDPSFRVAGVQYSNLNTYILLSKFAKNEPWREFTTAQAMVLPVIDGVEDIKLLNIKEVQG